MENSTWSRKYFATTIMAALALVVGVNYPDIGTITAVTDSTLLQYTGTGIGIGQDLFKITMHNVAEGTEFESCTLRSHMIAEGTPTGYSPTLLTARPQPFGVKSGCTCAAVVPPLP